MEKLKSCAHCGGIAERYSDSGDWGETYSVECLECGMTTGFRYTKAEADAAWNRRPE
jgi:Lar family restriction alleviation protein